MHDVIDILDRNWQWRRDAEEAERREQRIREEHEMQRKQEKKYRKYRWLAQCAYMGSGMAMSTTTAALLVGMPGWAAVTGATVTAILFAIGEACEEMRDQNQ